MLLYKVKRVFVVRDENESSQTEYLKFKIVDLILT